MTAISLFGGTLGATWTQMWIVSRLFWFSTANATADLTKWNYTQQTLISRPQWQQAHTGLPFLKKSEEMEQVVEGLENNFKFRLKIFQSISPSEPGSHAAQLDFIHYCNAKDQFKETRELIKWKSCLSDTDIAPKPLLHSGGGVEQGGIRDMAHGPAKPAPALVWHPAPPCTTWTQPSGQFIQTQQSPEA